MLCHKIPSQGASLLKSNTCAHSCPWEGGILQSWSHVGSIPSGKHALRWREGDSTDRVAFKRNRSHQNKKHMLRWGEGDSTESFSHGIDAVREKNMSAQARIPSNIANNQTYFRNELSRKSAHRIG